MGSGKRAKPKRLAGKLKIIRESLGLTAEELIDRLDCPEIPLYKASISMFESGKREPPLIILLRYAKLVKTSTDILIDDKLDLNE